MVELNIQQEDFLIEEGLELWRDSQDREMERTKAQIGNAIWSGTW